MKEIIFTLLLVLFAGSQLLSQSADTVQYKQVDATPLYMVVNYPPDFDTNKTYPAIVFFFWRRMERGKYWSIRTSG